MSNPTPSPSTRFGAQRGNIPGRPSIAWLRDELGKGADAHSDVQRFIDSTGRAGMDIRRAMVARLLQIAFTDEAICIGKDSDGELLKRISSRESLEAIKTLWLYDIGKPRETEGPRIQLPEGLIHDGMSLVDIAVTVYRWRLASGQMGEVEFAEMVKLMLGVDQARLALLLKLLGKDTSGKTPDQVLAMLNGETPKIPDASASADQRNVTPDAQGLGQANPDGQQDAAMPKEWNLVKQRDVIGDDSRECAAFKSKEQG
jgi:hypothetical protein